LEAPPFFGPVAGIAVWVGDTFGVRGTALRLLSAAGYG